MSEVSDRYERIADGFTARVGGVSPDGWAGETPCPEWTVADLVAHVVSTHRRVLALLDGSEAEPADTTGDLPAQWMQASSAMTGVLSDDARASTVVQGFFGDQPFDDLAAGLLCTDTLVHTWDLARATGQDEELDVDSVARSLAFLEGIDEAIRRPGGFAAKISPAANADAQTRFLNFAGRAV